MKSMIIIHVVVSGICKHKVKVVMLPNYDQIRTLTFQKKGLVKNRQFATFRYYSQHPFTCLFPLSFSSFTDIHPSFFSFDYSKCPILFLIFKQVYQNREETLVAEVVASDDSAIERTTAHPIAKHSWRVTELVAVFDRSVIISNYGH